MAVLVIESDQAERTSSPVFGAEEGDGIASAHRVRSSTGCVWADDNPWMSVLSSRARGIREAYSEKELHKFNLLSTNAIFPEALKA
jgi:hypothetical protein